MKIYLISPHPRAIQDVDEFVFSSEQIWRNLAFHHLLNNGSSAVNAVNSLLIQTRPFFYGESNIMDRKNQKQ